MKNSITCPACNSENPFYANVCKNCKSYLRERIFNIDLWSTISSLIENPSKAFRTVIFSEHKNFIFFIILIASAKHLVNARFISILTKGEFSSTVNLFTSYLIVLGSFLFLLLLFSSIIKIIAGSINIKTRFKDNLAVISYTQLPYIFALIILFPLELIIYGDYLFSLNPSPYTIKETIAILFTIVEVLIVCWSVLLSFFGFYTFSKNIIFSISLAIFYNTFYAGLLIILSLFAFSL